MTPDENFVVTSGMARIPANSLRTELPLRASEENCGRTDTGGGETMTMIAIGVGGAIGVVRVSRN
jgi:hypothetical protein